MTVALVCVSVFGMDGQYCQEDAALIGHCIEMNYDQHMCYAPETDFRIRLSAYDPAWCSTYPTNCLNGDTRLGTGLPHEDWYGVAAACPIGWVNSTVAVDGVGEWTCLDSGGGIKPKWWDGEWIIVVDILHQFESDPALGSSWPWWSLQNYEEWHRE